MSDVVGREASASQGTIDQLMQMVADLQDTVRAQSDQLQAQTSEIQSLHVMVRDQTHQIKVLQEDVLGLARLDILGWGEDEKDRKHVVGSFINSFKKLLKSLNGQFYHGSVHLEGMDPMLEYDALRPYWKELARALLRRHIIEAIQNDDRSNFSMIRIPLTKEISDVLAPGLIANAFRSLRLQLAHFDRDGIMFLMHLIERNGSLKQLFLTGSRFADNYDVSDIKDDVNRLCQIIKEHPSIELVDMEHCGSSTPSDLLCPIITASDRMKTIRLNRNNVCTMGRRDISDFLGRNPSLETLQLMGNYLNDDDAISIARALETNSTLSWIDFSEGNAITNVSTEVFTRLIFNPESMNSVSDSNHTLAGNFGDDDGWLSEFNRTYEETEDSFRHVKAEGSFRGALIPNTAKKLKLLALLSAPYEKTVHIKLLDGVPSELMPKVLELVQQYPEVSGVSNTKHWSYMAALRPDTPQGGEECDDGWLDDDSVDTYTWNNYYSSRREMDKQGARLKRLNLVYGILRGCAIQSL